MSSRSKTSVWWLFQAGTGLLLLVFVTMHILRVHLYGSFRGLPSYMDAINALKNPIIAFMAITFTALVAYHALYGIKMVVEELGIVREPSMLTRLLIVAGVIITLYVIFLVIYINLAIS